MAPSLTRVAKTTKITQKTEEAQKIEKVSQDTTSSVVVHNDGVAQKVMVYSMEMKDQVMQIIGSVGNRIVVIKATVCETGSGAVEKVRQVAVTTQATGTVYIEKAGNTLKAKTVFLQDGYVYVASKVEGQVVYAKAKVVEPIKSSALSLYGSSKKRIDPALQKLKPHYVRMHNGIVDVIGVVGARVVVIRTKIFDSYANTRVWTLQSLDGARAVVQGYTSPLLSKAISLRQSAACRVDHIFVTIKDGAVHLKGALGERVLQLRTKISEMSIYKNTSKGWQAAKNATLELTARVVQMVSDAYEKGLNTLSMVQCVIKDRYLVITCQAKDGIVFIRIKVDDIRKYFQSKSMEFYGATRASLANACSGAKTTVLNATEFTKTKALATSTNIRSLAANPDARAGAAGAVALGASGGVTGAFAGGAVGVMCALPAAFFTFGLSIPVGAAVGASAGGAVGGSAGLVAGGVAGYKAHKEKESIGQSISGAFAKAKARKDKAIDSASNLRSRVADRINGHTGGTDGA